MLNEPPKLTINTKRNRPSAAQIEAFKGVPTGFVCDAMAGRGALDPEIKPLPGLPVHMVGPALTCHSGPEDILGLMGALSELQPGDVIVNATGAWRGCAAIGDRVSGMAKNGGAAGSVTDGLARDLPGIQEVGLPLFACGLNPNSPFTKGPGSVGLPVELGGATVSSGDMVIGDQDGVVIVPFDRIDEIIEALKAVSRLESELDAKVADGLKVPDAIVEFTNGPQTHRI